MLDSQRKYITKLEQTVHDLYPEEMTGEKDFLEIACDLVKEYAFIKGNWKDLAKLEREIAQLEDDYCNASDRLLYNEHRMTDKKVKGTRYFMRKTMEKLNILKRRKANIMEKLHESDIKKLSDRVKNIRENIENIEYVTNVWFSEPHNESVVMFVGTEHRSIMNSVLEYLDKKKIKVTGDGRVYDNVYGIDNENALVILILDAGSILENFEVVE